MKITKIEDFNETIKEGLTLVDFYADWCNPCKMLTPVLEDLAATYQGKVNVIKVNVDEFRQLAEAYRVSSIPALFLIKNGSVVENIVGFQAKSALSALIEKHL